MVTLDVIMFGLMSLGLISILVVGWSMHAWKKIRERQKRIDKLNERVQRMLDDAPSDWSKR